MDILKTLQKTNQYLKDNPEKMEEFKRGHEKMVAEGISYPIYPMPKEDRFDKQK